MNNWLWIIFVFIAAMWWSLERRLDDILTIVSEMREQRHGWSDDDG